MKFYPRCRRDQLIALQKAVVDNSFVIDDVLRKCFRENLIRANDFRDMARFLSLNIKDSNESAIKKYKRKNHVDIEVETRSISTYTDILGGVYL